MSSRPITALVAVLASFALLLSPLPARAATPTPSALPAPPASLLNNQIDAHPGYQPQTTCSPTAKPGATALMKLLIATWGGGNWGITRACSSGGTSEHKEGRALDWHMDVKDASDRAQVADALAWITANNGEVARRLGVMYILWNQQQWATYAPDKGWKTFADRGSYTLNHKDHVHISLTWDGAMAQTSWWTGIPVTTPLTGPCGVGSAPACLPMIARSTTLSWPYQQTTVPATFVAAPKVVPIIAGTAEIGQTLVASPGSWVGSGAKLSYQWQRNRIDIPGATLPDLALSQADLGATFTVRVTAASKGVATSRTSAGTPAVSLPSMTAPTPAISGSFTPGKRLAVSVGDWTPEPTILRYAWLRDGRAIAKATGTGYQVSSADNGHRIGVRVTGSRSGYASHIVTSAATTVLRDFSRSTAPVVTGDAVVGGVLTATTAAWKPKATTVTYQWLADGVVIAKAAKASFTLTAGQAGMAITVRVTGSRSGYRSVTKTSAEFDVG